MPKDTHTELFSKLGIDIENDKISIDIAKTKGFFDALRETLAQKAQKLQKDIEEGKVDLGDRVGIKVENEKIDIDLGKTKSFIETLGEKVENFVKELESSLEAIGKPKD